MLKETPISISAKEALVFHCGKKWRGIYGTILEELRNGIFKELEGRKHSNDIQKIKKVGKDYLETFENDYHNRQGMLIISTIRLVNDVVKESEDIDTKLCKTIKQLEDKYGLNEDQFPRVNYPYFLATVFVDDD